MAWGLRRRVRCALSTLPTLSLPILPLPLRMLVMVLLVLLPRRMLLPLPLLLLRLLGMILRLLLLRGRVHRLGLLRHLRLVRDGRREVDVGLVPGRERLLLDAPAEAFCDCPEQLGQEAHRGGRARAGVRSRRARARWGMEDVASVSRPPEVYSDISLPRRHVAYVLVEVRIA